MKKIAASLLIVAGITTFGLPANAQSVSIQAVLAACTTSGASTQGCLAAQSSYVASLRAQGLPTAQVDAMIGQLVSSLASAPAANPAVVSAAITAAAAEVTSPAQSAAIAQVAAAVSQGAPVAPALISQAASPA